MAAQKVLIVGESGTGKSTSLRNCDPKTTAIVNPVGKPLPFKGSGKFVTLDSETDSRKVTRWMLEQARSGKKLIVVDDFQYILAVPFMERIKETGWDKWNDFGANYYDIIDVCKELPDDVVVAFLSHAETLDNGVYTIKLIGKMLREKITIEGLFTVVLRTGVNEGKYYFFTQNSGKDTVKSPLGMFPTYAIDNDLNYVADKIRNYFEVGAYKTDEEMAQADDSVAAKEIEKPDANGRRSRRKGNKDEKEEKSEEASEEKKDEAASKEKKRRARKSNAEGDESKSGSDAESDKSDESTDKSEVKKTHDEVVKENAQKIADYQQKVFEKIDEVAGEREMVPYDEVEAAIDEVEKPVLEEPPRRTRRERKEREVQAADTGTGTITGEDPKEFMNPPENTEDSEDTSATRRRRTRRTRS